MDWTRNSAFSQTMDEASPSPAKGGGRLNPIYDTLDSGIVPQSVFRDEEDVLDREGGVPPLSSLGRSDVPVPADAFEYTDPIHGKEIAAAALGSDRPEEERFEQVLRRLVTDEMLVADGIHTFGEICVNRADDLRSLASGLVEETPQYHALVKDAAELEAEGQTWSLLWYLFAIEDLSFPAGKGGNFVSGAGFVKTVRQHATDVVFQDGVLNRAARIVAWLEAGHAKRYPEPKQGVGRKDGIWMETKAMLDGGGRFGEEKGGVHVSRIDPDAMVREQAKISADNAKDEERLAKIIWRFVKSGRLSEAARVCQYVGQPWRAVSLTGYGMHGPLPLGASAEEADEEETGARQSEMLAGEIENGVGSKLLWRWACHAASKRISESIDATGYGVYESAVYALLAGDIKRAVRACDSWEDVLWVHLRCWLEYHVDSYLVEQAGRGTSCLDGIDMSEDAGNLESPHEWPITDISRQMPPNLEEAITMGTASYGGVEVGSIDRTKRYRKIQVDLALGKMEELLDTLIHLIVPETGSEETQQQEMCPPGLMRFSAHLALMLWKMNLVTTAQDEGTPLYTKLNDGLQKLLWIYTVHLIDTSAYSLVPSYLVHLRLGLRRTTMQLLLEESTCNETITSTQQILVLCQQWFGTYAGQGDFADDETLVSIRQFCDKSRESSLGGPIIRAQRMCWFFFDDSYRDEATRRAVVLCRDFSLSGIQGTLAALHLLKEVIPTAIGSENGLLSLCSRPEELSQFPDVVELICWERYFEILREYLLWEEIYGAAVQNMLESDDKEESQKALLDLEHDTVSLLNGITEFIMMEGMEWISRTTYNDVSTAKELEASIVIMPADTNLNDLSVYPAFSDASQTDQICTFIAKICMGIIDSDSGVYFDAVPTDNREMPHQVLLRLWMDKSKPDPFADTCISVFSTILKNGIKIGEDTIDVLASSITSTLDISSAICQGCCLPRLVLPVAVLREALAYMGSTASMENADIILKKAEHGWRDLWSDADLSELRAHIESGSKLLSS